MALVLLPGRDDGTTTMWATVALLILVVLGPILVGLAFRLWDRRRRRVRRHQE